MKWGVIMTDKDFVAVQIVVYKFCDGKIVFMGENLDEPIQFNGWNEFKNYIDKIHAKHFKKYKGHKAYKVDKICEKNGKTFLDLYAVNIYDIPLDIRYIGVVGCEKYDG